MKELERVRWDSIIIGLVNYTLKNKLYNNTIKHHFKVEPNVNTMTNLQERRSPEEFQDYLRKLFDNHGSSFNYHWYFSARKKRKNQYCGINS